MAIVHEAEKRRFAAYAEDGREMGEIVYEPRGDGGIAATHTRVGGEYRGRGVAGKLLGALAGWAEAEGVTIEPVCSYVEDAFAREPERYRKVMQEKGG